MLTKEQAMTAAEFHHKGCRDGFVQRVRRHGPTQTYAENPAYFRVPIAYGPFPCGFITHNTREDYHVVEECPLPS